MENNKFCRNHTYILLNKSPKIYKNLILAFDKILSAVLFMFLNTMIILRFFVTSRLIITLIILFSFVLNELIFARKTLDSFGPAPNINVSHKWY